MNIDFSPSYIQPTDQRNKYYAHACTNQILFSLLNIYEWVFILTVAESECDVINNAYPLCYFIRECAIYFFLTILYYITIWNSQLIKCERIFSSFFFIIKLWSSFLYLFFTVGGIIGNLFTLYCILERRLVGSWMILISILVFSLSKQGKNIYLYTVTKLVPSIIMLNIKD